MSIKEVVKSYIVLDDEVKILQKQIKALKQQQASLSQQIVDHLSANGHDGNATMTLGSNIFKIVKVKRSKVDKDALEEKIRQKIGDESTELILSESTDVNETSYLKRVTKK